LIIKSTEQSYKFLDRLMEYSTKLDQLSDLKEDVTITAFKKDILDYYANDQILKLSFSTTLKKLHINSVIVGQILTNLINNAEKYTDKPTVNVNIDISETDTHYRFNVSDNGPGIKKEYLEKIFKIFVKLSKTDKYGNEGAGLGLAIVSKLVSKSGGTIEASSEINKGSSFIFTILK
jgi:signal transduction histidine kinase